MQKPLSESHSKNFNIIGSFYRIVIFCFVRSGLLQFTFVAFLFSFLVLLFLPNVSAQIKINEKVEINPENSSQVSDEASPFTINYSGSQITGFTMQKTGLLEIEYFIVVHFDEPMPNYSALNINFLNGDSLKSYLLQPRFPTFSNWQNYYYNYCNASYEGINGYNYVSTVRDTLGSVNIGDTIQLSYYTDEIETQQPIEYGIYSVTQVGPITWYFNLGHYDDCLRDWDNQLYIYLRVWDEVETLSVSIEPSEVFPGDTAQVVVRKRLPGGTIEDFPPEQTFEIAKLEGCMLGNILVASDSGAYFYDVPQPIYFVAADSLVGDTTGTVVLGVGLVDNNVLSKVNVVNNIESNECFLEPLVSANNIITSFDVNKIEVEIISPTPLINDMITDEPRMPEIICKAELNTFCPGIIKYEWKYIVRKYYARRGKYTCIRISKSEFQGLSYSTSGGYTEWTVPFDIDSAYFYFKSVQPQKATWDTTQYYGCDGDVNHWYDESSDEIFTGGEVMITVIAKNYQTGKEIARLDTIKLNKILGLNPDPQTVITYANSNKMKAIIWKETAGTFKQFLETGVPLDYWWPFFEVGWPLYGYPNGFGLSQLDNYPPATERQMWNWKANVDRGKTKLQDCYDEVFENHSSPNDFKANWTNAFHNYNHGNGLKYYEWKGPINGWDESDQRDDEYGKEVYDKYIQYDGN